MLRFSVAQSLKKLELKDGRAPLSLGYNLFSEMEGRTLFHDTAVETLYLGRNLQFLSGEEYGGAPFSRMKKLQSVVVGDEVTAIPDDLFKNCPVLESFVVGKAVETIGNRAFQGCGNLSRLVFRDGDKPLLLGYNVHEPSGLGRSLFMTIPYSNFISVGNCVIPTRYITVTPRSIGKKR